MHIILQPIFLEICLFRCAAIDSINHFIGTYDLFAYLFNWQLSDLIDNEVNKFIHTS